jgi:hypothetical protein
MGLMDIESQEFFVLVTDALRAGPGSPQWHQAVVALREKQGGMDEYAMLYQAREHLESGKGYREVRAGPGFTRRVMDAVDQESEGGPKRGPSTATWIAIVSAVALVVIAGVVALLIVPGRLGQQEAVKQLEQTYFVEPWMTTNFDSASSGQQWQLIGSLPVSVEHGLTPATTQPARSKDYVGGGVASAWPLPADKSFAIEATVSAEGAGDDTITQVFVSDDSKFSEDRGASGHEVACMIQNGVAKVALPDGTVVDSGLKVASLPQPILMRVAFNGGAAAVDVGGKRIWIGGNQLDRETPRHVGVRFLQRGAGNATAPVVQSLRVMRPK